MIFELKRKVEKGERNDEMTRRSKSKAFSKYQFECSTYEWNNSFVSTVIRYSRIGICILENFLLNLSNVQRLFFAKLFDFALTFLTILNPLFYNLKKHFYSFYCLQIRRTTIFKMKKVYFRREYSNPSKYKNQDF